MKHTVGILLACLLVPLPATAEDILKNPLKEEPAHVAEKGFWTPYGNEKIASKHALEFYNSYNRYTFDYYRFHASKDGVGVSHTCVYAPTLYGNFSRPVENFANLVVNGIERKNIHSRPDQLVFKDNPDGGAEAVLTMNFDGAMIRARYFMRKDSPVFWCELSPHPDSITPIKTIEVKFTAMPSGLTYSKGEKPHIIWNGPEFAREAVTAQRKLLPAPEKQELFVSDKYLILQDANNNGDGAGREKEDIRSNIGPCFFVFDAPDKTLLEGRLDMKGGAYVSFSFKLNPEFRKFTFGIWQHKNRIRNDEFAAYLKNNMEKFQVK